MILIVTHARDPFPVRAIAALTGKGARHVRFDTDTFPQRASVSFRHEPPRSGTLSLRLAGDHVDLGDVTTVWYRRPSEPTPDPALSQSDRDFVRRESLHALNSLWHLLSDRFWVNPFNAGRTAEHKPYQLQVARSLGFDVPKTLITNDPRDLPDFFGSCTDGMIYKSLRPFGRTEAGGPVALLTNRVDREALTAHLEQVRLAPCIFQEYIRKKCELRVTVIGQRVFTCEIDSQADQRTKDDWRRDLHLRRPRQRATSLPLEIERKILALLSSLGLVFGCLDFVVTPDDRLVFLEINPSGQWEWIEHDTGMPLMDCFTDMLIRGHARDGRS